MFGDWSDLVDFWNLRATGRSVLFVPIAHYHSYESAIRSAIDHGHYPINPNVTNSADFQKGRSISESALDEILDWVKSQGTGEIVTRTWWPKFAMKEEYYVGDIHASDLEANRAEEIATVDQGHVTPIRLASPEDLAERAHKAEALGRGAREGPIAPTRGTSGQL